jgi:hypothetical protein
MLHFIMLTAENLAWIKAGKPLRIRATATDMRASYYWDFAGRLDGPFVVSCH